ncbi:MAG: nucleotidyltransferase [Spartobacteria bacterium]|nr:nucleotidyltransferase [Spartobacteria bacterium]
MIDYTKFKDSLKHLELQFENYKTLDESLPELMQEAVVESVIQRFEVCFDTLWKTLKRYMGEDLGLADLPNSPKPLLRIANENKLFAATLEDWIAYADARTNTSHDYSHEKAQETLGVIEPFIDDAIGLYQTMTGTTWE